MHGFAFYCRALLTLLAVSSAARAGATPDCRYGSYRLADGNLVNVAPDDDDTLRWIKFDGATGVLHKTTTGPWKSTYGWTDRADGLTVSFPEYQHADTPGHQACDTARIDFGGVSGQKVALETKEATFKSHGTLLAGRLVMPKGEDRIPIVVLLHGSEQASALSDYSLQTYFLQQMLPAEGVGAFVYDKRGTGKSGGHYTQVCSLLADDAVAAARKARELAGARLRRIGYQGEAKRGGSHRSRPTARQ